MSSLRTAAAQGVLREIRAFAADADAAADAGWKAVLARGAGADAGELIDVYGAAPMSVTPEVGELLYGVAFAHAPALVVEFGTSFGVSALYLAAALADAGTPGARLIASEAHPGKARRARANLEQAGLGELVDVRLGDARETLADIDGPIDLLFLDGMNRLYLPLLRMLEGRLADDALVVADLSARDPDRPAYIRHVRDRARGYSSVTVAVGDGVELSRRCAPTSAAVASAAAADCAPAPWS